MSELIRSFAPIAAADARVLILGSMPGVKSLQAGQYYAHPQNRFWTFMGELVGAHRDLPYPERCERLKTAGIALWDVLASCEREGSLDSAIRDHSAEPNDFPGFVAAHPGIGHILFNGTKAADSFRRSVAPALAGHPLRVTRLPSTSPANASQRPADKLAAWRDALQTAGVILR